MISSPTPVVVLGGTGMLGSMIVDVLAQDARLAVTATAREPEHAPNLDGVEWKRFGGAGDLDVVEGHSWVINAVGIIKPLIRDDNSAEVEDAIRVNALLPYELAEAARDADARVIQIATDCVYSGTKGRYSEGDPHDPTDVYGKTKSLGETQAANVHHIRVSIIGPEAGRSRSLLEWFRGQPEGSELNGFVNHLWNGVSTLHFAKVCSGVVTGRVQPLQHQHLVPTGEVTKYELLRSFASAFDRHDLTINPTEAATVIDRTLTTKSPDANVSLWQAAGYAVPPTVGEMVAELAQYRYRPALAGSAPPA
jgi:dTDP-4-dehydrorhamnose reductase